MSPEKMDQAASPRLDHSGIARIFQIVVSLLIITGLLFGSAGRLDWWEAWVFLALFTLFLLVNAIWLLRNNLELINERGKMAGNIKVWDKLLVTLYFILLLVSLLTTGLDARFHWSSVPLILEIAGGIGFILALCLTGWALMTNPFLAAFVRIQDDRGHRVVTMGPYHYVRHPMYASMFFFFWGIPLLLGSFWALIPGVLNVIVFIIRTTLEDKTLQAELPGYADYARQVRYRLIPGIW
jgi:protein-S-isoprenylcysteine O-methyltransferase Ste14